MNYQNKEIYFYRNLIESQQFSNEFRLSIEESEKERDSWILTKRKLDFGIFSEPEKKDELSEVKIFLDYFRC